MTLYTAALTLILVMDPLGNIPIFVSLLKRFDPATQRRIILRECFIAFLVLSLFLFFGRYILHGMNITTPALSIAGGIILFLIAIRMIFPSSHESVGQEKFTEPFIVPLAIPMTAGPSALAMVMLFATREPHHLGLWFFAVIIACVLFTIILLASGRLMRLLGERGLITIERLMGMILTTISVQMFMSGISQYFAQGAKLFGS